MTSEHVAYTLTARLTAAEWAMVHRRAVLLNRALKVLDEEALRDGPLEKNRELREEIRKEITSRNGVLIIAKTSAGTLSEHTLPHVTRSELIQTRDLVELHHLEAGHHLAADGSELSGQSWAGFVKSCVPQSEARAILQKANDRHPDNVPLAVMRILAGGGLDSMILLYAVTLKLAKSKTKVGGGVWIEDRTA